jgi:hypothetical protein
MTLVCPVIVECGQPADAQKEKDHVWAEVDRTRRPERMAPRGPRAQNFLSRHYPTPDPTVELRHLKQSGRAGRPSDAET